MSVKDVIFLRRVRRALKHGETPTVVEIPLRIDLEGRIEEMRQNIASMFDLEVNQISICYGDLEVVAPAFIIKR